MLQRNLMRIISSHFQNIYAFKSGCRLINEVTPVIDFPKINNKLIKEKYT